ncbi:MAG: hypothetical protein EBW74_06380 [Betaproteobacteria bacterium]|nr:hypothetical protein [Betaproteobacteria bacterium]
MSAPSCALPKSHAEVLKMSKVTLDNESRRNFLVRSVATAGGAYFSIGLGAGLMGEANAAIATSAYTPSIWFTITPDSKVTMHIVKTEMGQHIGTGLAQVIAEELEVKWEDVRLDSPLESVENFAIYGLAYTVNSGSMTTEFDRISRAGAAGRMALIDAAEIDPAIIEVAKRFLNFREDERMRAYARDGRNFIEGAKLSYDIIMLDAFSAEAVPKHLSTTEFLQAVKKVLAVNGVVVANLWGPALNPLYDSMLRTFQDVFSDLYLLEVPEVENRLMFALPRRIDLRMATFREHAHNTSLVLGLPFDLALMIGTGFYRIDKPITKGRVLRD